LLLDLIDLVEGEHEVAVPLLIIPLEGAFWRLAEQRGLIEKNRKGKWLCTAATGNPGRQIDGVEGVLRPQGLDLAPR
jgi:hypothetical protein